MTEYFMCNNCGVKIAEVVAKKNDFDCHLCSKGKLRKLKYNEEE
jgi:transcription initiation factor IIE alpha subunit